MMNGSDAKRRTVGCWKNLKSFALRSVKNECLNRLKHHEVKLRFTSQTRHQSELYQIETNNMREQILGFINQLPEKQKMVIHLKMSRNMRFRRFRKLWRWRKNAVRVNLMRADKSERIN
jgi:RNA polymerase sigma-70 factor (ECF subfamily)